jgi:protein-tyrosine phosphatase
VIDTHCHLLPGLDDGPATAEAAVELAAALAGDGVEAVVCTPHWSRQFPTDHAVARERLDDLRGLLAGGPRLELSAEVSPGFAVEAPVEELAARSIAGRYVLVEVLADTRPLLLDAVADRLAAAGLVPILGHPERSRAGQEDPAALDAVRRRGALAQVVAPSLLGRWGEAAERCAWRLVQTGRADLLASDAHGVERRRCHLREAAAAVADRVGANVANALVRDRPAAVLRGEHPG